MARGTSDSERAHDADDARPESGHEAGRSAPPPPSIHRILSVAAEEYLKWSQQREHDEHERIEGLLRESAQVMLDEVLSVVQARETPKPTLDSATVATIVREELAIALRNLDRGISSDAVEHLVAQKLNQELQSALTVQQHEYESQLHQQEEAAKARHESTEALLQQTLEQAINRVKEQTSRTATVQATEVATQIARELTDNLRDSMDEQIAETVRRGSNTAGFVDAPNEPPPFDTTSQHSFLSESDAEDALLPPEPEPSTLGQALDTGTFRQQEGRNPLGFLKPDDPLKSGGANTPEADVTEDHEVAHDTADQLESKTGDHLTDAVFEPETATPVTIEYASEVVVEPANEPEPSTTTADEAKDHAPKSSFPSAPRPTSDRDAPGDERHIDAAFAEDSGGVRESLFAEIAPVGRDDVPMSGPLLNFFSGYGDTASDSDHPNEPETKPTKKRGFFRRNKDTDDAPPELVLSPEEPKEKPSLPPPPPVVEHSTKDWTSTPAPRAKPSVEAPQEVPSSSSEFESLWNSTDDAVEETLEDEYGETYDPEDSEDDSREATRDRLSELGIQGDESAGGPSLSLADFTHGEDSTEDSTEDTAGSSTSGRSKSKKRKEKAEKPTSKGPQWVKPVDGECPPGYPIKAIYATGRFHLPEGRGYDRVRPDCCYITAEAAEKDGFKHSFW